MNTFLTSRYSELVQRGALGVELRDALRDQRLGAPISASLEAPLPLVQQLQRAEAPDPTTQNPFIPVQPYATLPVFPKSTVYLQGLFYTRMLKTSATVRLDDPVRHFVPRRLQYPVLTQTVADTNPPNTPNNRVRPTALYPGAAYPFDTGATGIRGRVARAIKNQPSSQWPPVRWARIEARISPGAGQPVVGRAHGDDRGEFLLLLWSTSGPMGALVSNFNIDITVYGPSAQTNPSVYAIDPLGDLPIEVVGPATGSPDLVALGETIPNFQPATKTTITANFTVTLGQVISPPTPFPL
jgi:hypothetical protein